MDRALELLSDMKKGTQSQKTAPEVQREPIQPDSFTYSALLTLCQRTGNATYALDLMATMQQEGVKVLAMPL